MRRRWQEWRAAPWRRELLGGLMDGLAAERAAAGDDWRGLVVRLAATVAMDHVAWAHEQAMHPRLLVLLVGLGRVTADEAVERLDVTTYAGGEALAEVWRGLSTAGLCAALGRVRWGSYLDVPEDVLAAMVRRARERGVGDEALVRVRELSEPRRSRMLLEIFPGVAEEVAGYVAGLGDPLERVGMLARISPGTTSRGGIEAVCAAEWTRLAAIEDTVARCAGWEQRMAQLGALATLAESRRWLSVLRAAMTTHPDEVFRLQTGVPAALWGEALEGLAPALACEGMVWLVRGDEGADARPALRAVLECEGLAERDRVRLLGLLLERLDEESGEVAARAVLGSPACAQGDALAAIRRLPAAEQAARVDAWCHEGPFVQGAPGFAVEAALAVLARLAEAGGSAEIVGLARELTAGWSKGQAGAVTARWSKGQAGAWIDFVRWMPEAERVGLARRVLAGGCSPTVAGRWLGLVPEAEAVLAGEIEKAREIAEAHARWSALAELVAELPEALGAAMLRALWARRGGGEREIWAFPPWAMDAELQRARVAEELARPYRPYTAWLLGSYARPLPAEERAAVLDRAIEEFRGIALAPTGPGNDAGPFVDMADMLDEAQTRRALAVTEVMAGAAWGGDLENAREALALRLVELGRVDEGERMLREIPGDRAWGLGVMVGRMLARGTGWDEVAGRVADEAPLAVITGVVWAMPAAARVGRGDVADGLLRWVPRVADAEERVDALEGLIDAFAEALPAERWAAAIHEHGDGWSRARLQLKVAKAAGARALAREAAESLREAEAIEGVIDELCAAAELLPITVRVGLLERWLGGSPRANFTLVQAWSEDEVGREIAAVLRERGGEEALVTAAREVAAVAGLLG